jgi:hypothetical protein
MHFGRFILINGEDTLKLDTHSGYSRIEPGDSIFLTAEVPILISKQLPHKVSIEETLEYLDLEELPIEYDSIRSEDSNETFTTINSFFNKLTPSKFKKELYNFVTESKILYLSHEDSYEIDPVSEVAFHNCVGVKIRDNFFLEFISEGKTLEKYIE